MKINRKLNLVMPVDRDDGSTIWVHSTPISREVFNTYFLVVSKAFSAMYAEGLSHIAGPRVAGHLLKKVAVSMGVWDGPGGVQNGLVAEIRRLTNVLVPSERGWQSMPFQDVFDKKLIDEDDLEEVDNALAFFMVVSLVHKRRDLPTVLEALTLWGAQTSSLGCMEYMGSLPTSTPEDNTGGKTPASSLPL